VLDFGIAKARGASTQTQEGTVKGKYAYMAPEQLKGNAIDRRVDVFALGVVLYEMLALRRLFQRKTDYLTFRAVMEQPIPDIRRYRADLPDGVADALSRALDRDPATRFETARQFGTAVLDGMQGTRPWTQGEISDFVRSNFAEEIGKRSQKVASVVARTQSGHASSRATMPLIAHPEEGTHEADEDEDFPPVETEVEGAPPWMPKPTPRPMAAAGNPADFQTGGTPPPFGAETTGSAPSLQPLQRPGAPAQLPTQSQIVVAPKRSVFWPIFGVVMVAITGGALFLVWQQMQKPQQPAEIKITQEPATKPPEQPGSAATVSMDPTPVETQPAEPGSNAAAEPQHKKDPPKPKTFQQQLTSALSSQLGSLKSCINEHPETREIIASIAITSNGKAKSVSLQPADIDAGPLGACLKNVLKRTAFPSGRETSFSVPLKPRGG
jgi:serine/threonine-protein kinase